MYANATGQEVQIRYKDPGVARQPWQLPPDEMTQIQGIVDTFMETYRVLCGFYPPQVFLVVYGDWDLDIAIDEDPATGNVQIDTRMLSVQAREFLAERQYNIYVRQIFDT